MDNVKLQQAFSLIANGISPKEAAEALGVNRHTLRGRMSEARRKGAMSDVELPKIVPFTGESALPNTLSEYTAHLRLAFDSVMIAGDLHAPTFNRSLTARMCEMAARHLRGHKTLLLVGDSWNGDRDSVHAPHGGEMSRSGEFAVVKTVLRHLLGTFDDIYMTPGNHLRKRYLATLGADVTMAEVVRVITQGDDDKRVHLSPYDLMEVTSGGARWVCTHQYQYSKLKLRVADELALKYQANIITFHQHHTAMGRDRFDRYTIVDCGGLHEAAQMGYIGLVPSTRNVPNAGFVFLRDGTAHLMTPYATMTDWRMWGMDDMALREAA